MSSPIDYKIKPVTTQDTPAVLRFLREFHYEDEPLNSYIYSTQKENVRYRDRGVYAASCIDEDLSFMAFTPLGRIVAIILNESAKGESEVYVPENNPIFPKIKKIVAETDAQIDVLAPLTKGDQKEMSLKVISIHPEWRNKGIGRELLNHTRDIAQKNCFCQMRSTCSSAYSAKMLANFGFECVYAINYADYKVNGEVVFKPPKPHTAMKAMVFKM